MNILVTGGNGYLGAKISQHLHDIGHNVTSLFRNKLDLQDIQYKVKFVDWENYQSIQDKLTNIDVVIHAAGMNFLSCEKDPKSAFRFNGLTTQNLINASISKSVKKFIYFSTIHVYSDKLIGLIDENSKLLNSHPYATSHVAGENYVLHAAKTKKIDGVVLRLSNIFGCPSSQFQSGWDLLVNNLCKQVVESNQIILNSDGQQLRDIIPISNLCNITTQLLQINCTDQFNSIINIGTGDSYKVIDIARLVQSRFEKKFGIKTKIKINNSNKSDTNIFKYASIYSSIINKYKTVQIINEIDSILDYCSVMKNTFEKNI
jgi:UDP-glucose 4-epimerase